VGLGIVLISIFRSGKEVILPLVGNARTLSSLLFSSVVALAGVVTGIGTFGVLGIVGIAIMSLWAPETRDLFIRNAD